MRKIPYADPMWDKEEQAAAIDTILRYRFTIGKSAVEFEREVAKLLDVNYCVLVNSGSSANLLAFASLCAENQKWGIEHGDEVITVAAGFPSTVFPIIQYGAIPVFVDVDIPSYNVNIDALKNAITSKTKAVFLAHTMGNPFNVYELARICKKHDLKLIEDNCDSLGSIYGGLKTGGWGDVSTLSFFPAHHIAVGEGGMVCTNNPMLERIVRSLRDWGRDCTCPPNVDGVCGKRFSQKFGTLPKGYDHKYVYTRVGYNLKGTETAAAIGLAQLKKLPMITQCRRDNWEQLKSELRCMADVLILPEPEPDSAPSWFAFMITTVAAGEGEHISQYLEANGIQTRRLFAGNITRQPCMEGRNYRISGDLTNSDKVMNDTFAVGIGPKLTEDDITYVADKVKGFYGR